MATHGAALTRARAHASERIAGELGRAFGRVSGETRPIEARYQRGGSDDEQTLRQSLEEGRERDRHRGNAGVGPHRDDLVITLGGYDVRVEASQGEHRAITMALKMA